jgi:hypothetical protein
MPSRKLLLLCVVLMTAVGCSSSPAGDCEGPQDCGGNPCCWSVVDVMDRGRTCTMAATACVPVLGVDTLTTRVCQSDADCTAGGISTALTRCCSQSSHAFKACLAACPP